MASRSIAAEILSTIMTVGRKVPARGIVGMVDASATRRPDVTRRMFAT